MKKKKLSSYRLGLRVYRQQYYTKVVKYGTYHAFRRSQPFIERNFSSKSGELDLKERSGK